MNVAAKILSKDKDKRVGCQYLKPRICMIEVIAAGVSRVMSCHAIWNRTFAKSGFLEQVPSENQTTKLQPHCFS